MNKQDKPLYRIGEISAYTGLHRGTVRRWIDLGKIQYVRLPTGERRIPRAALEKLIASLGLRDDPWTE